MFDGLEKIDELERGVRTRVVSCTGLKKEDRVRPGLN